MTMTTTYPGLVFGIYPGMTGEEITADGPTVIARGPVDDDPPRTMAALAALESGGARLIVRCYLIYSGGPEPSKATPKDVGLYTAGGRRLDLVLCYRPRDGDLVAWQAYVRRMVARFGAVADAIQITEEPNNPHTTTGGDGASPLVRQAMVDGVVAAKEEARDRGHTVAIGVALTPSFAPGDDFWSDVAARITPAFLASLDYVGLDFFPDVFRPLPTPTVEAAVEGVLSHFRTVNLAAAGIPARVPIRITEHGWPTGEGRPVERQADVLDRVVRTVHRLRRSHHITHYSFFMLRDGDSDNPAMSAQWGLLRHDYVPKPAFAAYRRLIAELGGS